MTTYIIDGEKKFELTDRWQQFNEGEKIVIDIEGKRISKSVFSVTKILRQTGDKFDVDLEVVIG